MTQATPGASFPGPRSFALALCALLVATPAACDAAGEEAATVAAPIVVPALLGASREALSERFGDALQPVGIDAPGSALGQIRASTRPATREEHDRKPAPSHQARLARPASGELRRVEYDLSRGRVYRVRWQFAERFERPLMDDIVARVTQRLGKPDYDQTLRAKPGTARADLRRSGWTLGARALEIRQLHPFTGGPIFLSLADRNALQAIVDGREIPLPQPDSSGAWWRRPQRPASLPTMAERRELADRVDTLVAKLLGPPS